MDPDKMSALKSEFEKEYPEFISFFKTRGQSILTVVLASILLFMGVRYFMSRGDTHAEKAAQAMNQAQQLEDLEKITADYASTPSAPLAFMAIAKSYFDRGDYDMALSKYIEFQTKYPKHPLALSVELNRINCLEARGDTQEAITAYENFIKDHPDHFLTNEALFGKARCLEAMGQWQEAKTIYEDYMVANPRGSWFPRAEDALDIVDKHLTAKPVAE